MYISQEERIYNYRLNNAVDHVFSYYSEQDRIQAIREQEQENSYLEELEEFEQDFEYLISCHDNSNNSFRLFKSVE
jgi:hypothetical protein